MESEEKPINEAQLIAALMDAGKTDEERKNERLRDALAFYASPAMWIPEVRFLKCGCPSTSGILIDRGRAAAAALAGEDLPPHVAAWMTNPPTE